MKRVLPLVLSALAFPGALAGSTGVSGDGGLTVFSRSGLSALVANGYDGSSYSIRLTHYHRNGSLLRDSFHSDGYQELARAVSIDDEGSLYVAGVRYWQARRYLWAMKYSAAGRVEWEWSDDAPGCAAADIEVGGDGTAWIAGSCPGGSRLARLSDRGYLAWAHTDASGSDQVSDLSVDAGGRAALTSVAGGRVRTFVVDAQGRQLATY